MTEMSKTPNKHGGELTNGYGTTITHCTGYGTTNTHCTAVLGQILYPKEAW